MESVRKRIAAFFWIIGAILMIDLAITCWQLRDGYAPGWVESHSIAAWHNFWDCFSVAFLIYVSPFLIVGSLIFPWKVLRKRSRR